MQINLETLLEVILENKQEKLIGECLKRQLGMVTLPKPQLPTPAESNETDELVYIYPEGWKKPTEKTAYWCLKGGIRTNSKLALVKNIKDAADIGLKEAKEFVDKLENSPTSTLGIIGNVDHIAASFWTENYPDLQFAVQIL